MTNVKRLLASLRPKAGFTDSPAFWAVLGGAVMHYVWGVTLLLSADPTGVTPVHTLAEFFGPTLAPSLIAVATLALVGVLWSKGVITALLCAGPQQFFMLLTALGVLSAVASGAYADGVVRGQLFILADQTPTLVITALHTVVIARLGVRKSLT
jgi:hypothetical protein